MELATHQDPSHRAADAWAALWSNAARSDRLADDLMVFDPSEGFLTLRSFDTRCQALRAHFPDVRMMLQDCVWIDGPEGYRAFARLAFSATHTRSGPYGTPTHKPLSWQSLAIMYGDGPKVTELVMLRDTSALLTQTGQLPATWVETQRNRYTAPPHEVAHRPNPWSDALTEVLYAVMDGDFTVLEQRYDRGAELFYPGGARDVGPFGAERFWLSLRASAPRAQFSVTEVIANEDPLSSPRVAAYWRLAGIHDGWGRFGAPSGCDIQVDGITFVEFGPGGIRREWTVIDDTAVFAQIFQAAQTPMEPAARATSWTAMSQATG